MPRGCPSPSAVRGCLRAERSGLQPCPRFVSSAVRDKASGRRGAAAAAASEAAAQPARRGELEVSRPFRLSRSTGRCPAAPSGQRRHLSRAGAAPSPAPLPAPSGRQALFCPSLRRPWSPARLPTAAGGSAAGMKARQERRERVRAAGDGGSAAVGAEPSPPLHPRLAASASCPRHCHFLILRVFFTNSKTWQVGQFLL